METSPSYKRCAQLDQPKKSSTPICFCEKKVPLPETACNRSTFLETAFFRGSLIRLPDPLVRSPAPSLGTRCDPGSRPGAGSSPFPRRTIRPVPRGTPSPASSGCGFHRGILTRGSGRTRRSKKAPCHGRGRKVWSGKRDSNPRLPAWEASILPLNYSRLEVYAGAGDGI